MKQFDTVLFDWMLTLAHYPVVEEQLIQAFRKLNRLEDPVVIAGIAKNISEARNIPEAKIAAMVEDTSTKAHAYSELLVYKKAGIDEELADAMYQLLGTLDFHRPYPDSKPVLETLKSAGFAIGVVSDIHTDLRAHARAFGWEDLIDCWSLSWEQGIQKPNLKMFKTAIDQLDCDPVKTVMVGDRGAVDGAAAALGVTCIILPAINLEKPDVDRGLSVVLKLVGLA